MDTMKTPRQGPTPVGQRNRASTIPAKKAAGPTADEWDDLEPVEPDDIDQTCDHSWRYASWRDIFVCRHCHAVESCD